MNKNQNGFSIIHVLLTTVAVGVITFTGVKVYSSNHKSTVSRAPKSASTKASQSTIAAKTQNTIPADYVTYKDTANEFTISYPKAWGTTTVNTTTADTYLATTAPLKDLSFTNNESTATLNGSFIVKSAPKAGFQISTGKYGATLQATLEDGNYVWKVITANPADTSEAIGSTYHPKLVATDSGIKLYNFSQGDEGALTSVWILEKGSNYILIALPTMESPDAYLGGAYGSSDIATYAGLGMNILNTITN